MTGTIIKLGEQDALESKQKPFWTFLETKEIERPEKFSSIKNPGGTLAASGDYVAGLMYFIKTEQDAQGRKVQRIQRVFVPYIMGKKSIEKPLSHDAQQALEYEIREETGIQIIFDQALLFLQQELPSFEGDGEIHRQHFYLIKVKESIIERYLREFSGLNNYDPDKGKPFVASIDEAFMFLPTNHLIAEIEGLPHIIKRYQIDNRNAQKFTDHYELRRLDMIAELERRKQEKLMQG